MKRRTGFTLIELLVVIAIIAVLLGLLMPAVQKIRAAADKMRCANTMHQLSVAAHHYHNDYNAFPPGVNQYPYVAMPRFRGFSLFVYLLPYMEFDNLYKQWDFTDPLNNTIGGSDSRTATIIKILICPADKLPRNPIATMGNRYYGLTSYGGNGGTRSFDPMLATVDGLFHTTGPGGQPNPNQTPVTIAGVRDGTAFTLLFGERDHDDPRFDSYSIPGWIPESMTEYGWWAPSGGRLAIGDVTMSAFVPINYKTPLYYGEPGAPTSQAAFAIYQDERICGEFGSKHPNGANFAMADASVRFITQDLPLDLLRALATRNGSEALFDF